VPGAEKLRHQPSSLLAPATPGTSRRSVSHLLVHFPLQLLEASVAAARAAAAVAGRALATLRRRLAVLVLVLVLPLATLGALLRRRRFTFRAVLTLAAELLDVALELRQPIAQLLGPAQLLGRTARVGIAASAGRTEPLGDRVERARNLLLLPLARVTAAHRLGRLAHPLRDVLLVELTCGLAGRTTLLTLGLALRATREARHLLLQALRPLSEPLLLTSQTPARILARFATLRVRRFVGEPPLLLRQLTRLHLQITERTPAIIRARGLHFALELP
jgi:hypothetical protein